MLEQHLGLEERTQQELHFNFMPAYNQNRNFGHTQVMYTDDQNSAMSTEEYIPGMFSNTQLPEQSQVQREQTANGESKDDRSELSEADFDDQQSETEDFRTSSSISYGTTPNSLRTFKLLK
jgi:hypothetical protein